MTTQKYLSFKLGIAFLFLLFCSACEKMDSTYVEYIEGGEIIYIGKIDSLDALPGNNRIKITWKFPSDPKISKLKIYWNNKADSVIQTVQKPNPIYGELVLNNMPEGAYFFDVIAYDNDGNSSVKVSKGGVSYGALYNSTLLNRPIKAVKITAGKGIIDWYSVVPSETNKMIQTEITYNDITDAVQTVIVPADQVLSTELPAYKSGNAITYKTLYLPTANAIDGFYSNTNTRIIP